MQFLKFTLLIGTIYLAGCGETPSTSQTASGSLYQSILDGEVVDSMPGILVHVEYPAKGISWSGAAGINDVQEQDRLQPDDQFRIASVTKTYVAASILRLWEDGILDLDDPIENHLSSEYIEILKKGAYAPDKITIRHLLRHASGLYDHTQSPNFFGKIIQEPKYHWTRKEQIIAATEWGEPLGQPGAVFSYSDTGYLILAEIMERHTGKSMGDSFEELLGLSELELNNTWVEDERDDRRIHQYTRDGMDTYEFSPTIDYYGGGGLIATTKDIANFFQALFNEEIFKQKSTLDTMLAPYEYEEKPRMDYRLGIYRVEINEIEGFVHSGYWGTEVVYFPSLNATIAANYSQGWTKSRNAPIIGRLLKEL